MQFFIRITIACMLALGTTASGFSGEIRFRSACVPGGDVVTLGDLAEIQTIDPEDREKLAEIELFAAPSSVRSIRAREVQDRLLLRGISLANLQFSGAAAIEITPCQDLSGEAPVQANAMSRPSLSGASERRAYELVQKAARNFLSDKFPQRMDDKITFALSDEQSALVLQSVSGARIGCAALSADVPLRLSVFVEVDGQVKSFEIDVNLVTPSLAVVTKHGVTRGSILRESDVELRRVDEADGFTRLDDVVGREAKRALSAGEILSAAVIESPAMLRRGDVVTVYARSNGLQIKSNGRAREDGRVGDVIAIESIQNRETFQARVTGVQVVEVIAAGATSFSDAISGVSR